MNLKNISIKTQHPSLLDLIYEYIRPETTLEKTIVTQELWMEGAFWGSPRPGHPEGKVLYHIGEVLQNIDRITTDPVIRQKLRLIAIVHDTFKYKEEQTRPRIDWSKHHAVFARHFTANFIKDEQLLAIIELHDEAYYAWCIWSYKKDQVKSMARLQCLFNRIGAAYLQLFYLFFKCDTFTGDKIRQPIYWFENIVADITVANLK